MQNAIAEVEKILGEADDLIRLRGEFEESSLPQKKRREPVWSTRAA